MIPSVGELDRTVWTVVGLMAAISVGTVIRLVALRNASHELASKRLRSLRTWWLLVLLCGLAALLGPIAICSLLCLASCLAYSEYSRLAESRSVMELRNGLILFVIILLYLAVWAGLPGRYLTACVVAAFGISVAFGLSSFPSSAGGAGRDEEKTVLALGNRSYVMRVAVPLWGFLVVGFGAAHAAMLLNTTSLPNSVGRFLYLLILTESNDIAQALVGRRFSDRARHPIAPVISPNKSWEGLVGGVVITSLVAVALAFLLDLFGEAFWLPAAASGMLIGIVGFLGDINMSALKRDAGVKDSSDALPGMGGMLDRIDSLTFTAPLFYYFVIFVPDFLLD